MTGPIHRFRQSPVLASAASQLVYGLSNFLLLATIAASASDVEMGAASLVYLHLLFWTAVARAASGEVLLIRHAQLRAVPQAFAGSYGGALLLGVLGAVATAALGTTSLSQGSPLVFAAALPMIVLHDVGRAAHLARRDPIRALRGDATWLGCQVVVMLLAAAVGALDTRSVIVAWAIGAACGAADNIRGLSLELTGSWTAFSRLSAGIRRSLVATAATLFASRNLTYYLIGSIAGLAVLGDLRRALIPFAPLTAIFIGVSVAMIPTLSSGPRGLVRGAVTMSLALAAAASAWTIAAVAVTASGLPVVTDVIGDDERVVALLGGALVFQALSAGAVAGLRAGGAPRGQLWTVASGLVIMVSMVPVVVPRWGAAGGAASLMAGNAAEGLGALFMLHRLRTADPSPVRRLEVGR